MGDINESLLRFLTGVMVSLLGGLVRVLRKIEKPTFTKIVKELVISGFTGMMVYYLISDVVFIGVNVKMFLVGMSGYSGPVVLDMLEKLMIKIMKKVMKNGS